MEPLWYSGVEDLKKHRGKEMDSRVAMTEKVDINVTPYIDILLVLLIIFMVIQPTTQYDLEARAPHKADPGQKTSDDIIVISISSESRMINHEAVALDQLGSRFFQILSPRVKKDLFVSGAADLPFGIVARIIDIAKGSGAGDVGLLIEGQ